ncbi:transglycosylase SLT domain-containing protein [Paraburkholderia diazotrophica]|uniref:Transglycosylase SLT domain-containing protein n=1 Tax=Paraburkholderia diazotrophica TaxID=667676 RepID=A0A1H6TXJ1_9BURK|nr:transglycosylase SLT domain-containing protein [Paraburkholderia diazotrophica]SEI80482.1 Transglycosylase SLT domain-containing protein [Paraburkholderia diazotrophica]
MSGVKIPVEATLDSTQTERALQQLTDQINKMGESIARANRVQFNPISKTSLEDLKRVNAQFEELKRGVPSLAKEIQASGQAGAGFFDLDWSRMFSSAIVRHASRYGAYERVTRGTGAGFQPIPRAPTPTPSPATGSSPSSSPAPGSPGSSGVSWRGIGRNILGSGLRAVGPFGVVANDAISAGSAASAAGGLSAGAMAGLAGLAGGLLAMGIGKAVSAVKDKIGTAERLDVGYDTMKRQLGDVNVGFEALKVSLQDAAGEFGATFEETQKVASSFAQASGIFGQQAKTLAAEARVAGGFARSFGLDPARSATFFGQMRQAGVTSDEQGSRRVALMIGEAIAKSGAFEKADEVLQAVAAFTMQQTRTGLTAANAAGYAGEFAGLAGSRTPGLDPEGVSGILSRVNAAIAAGGNAGEAGQNFLYTALGQRNGLDPIQTKILEEQGAFGTGAATFGPGSLWSRFAEQNHLRTPGIAVSSNQTNLSLVMSKLRQVYAGRPELMLSALSNLTGTNISQAMALSTTNPMNVNGMGSRLSRLGIDLTKVNATGISRLSQIEADKSFTDVEKDRQAKAVASQNQESTEGDRTRKSIADVANEITKLADKAVPLMNDMRTGILFLAGGGKKSQRQVMADIANAEYNDAAAPLLEQQDVLHRQLAPKIAGIEGNRASTAAARRSLADVNAKLSALQSQRDWAVAHGETGVGLTQGASVASPSFLAALDEDDRAAGLPKGVSRAIAQTESSFDASATNLNSNGTADEGLFQINSKTLAGLTPDFQKKFGRAPDPYRIDDSRELKNMLLRQYARQFHGDAGAVVRAFHRGPTASAMYDGEGDRYLAKVNSSIGTPMPDEARVAMKQAQSTEKGAQVFEHRHEHTHTVVNGRTKIQTRTYTTQVNAPKLQGVN